MKKLLIIMLLFASSCTKEESATREKKETITLTFKVRLNPEDGGAEYSNVSTVRVYE